jgi:hypothetical protein
MTASTEKEEYVQIYEEIKRRQAEYEAAHPGKYYLLSEEEMDDIDSYKQIECLRRLADERKKAGKLPLPPRPTAPEKSLRAHVEEMIAEQAKQQRVKDFEASLDEIVRELNYYEWARSYAESIDFWD